MKKRTSLKILTIMTLVSLALMGCTSKTEKSGESGKKAKESNVEYDTKLNIAVTAQPPTIDAPMTVSQVALDIAQNMFETLYTLDKDYKPTPMLAKSVDISEDNKTYTFTLREGVKFHNGKEMTSEDVEASMNRWLEKSSRAKSLIPNAKFVKSDKYVVTLNLETPATEVLTIMSSQANFPAILPKEVIENAPTEGINEYIGTGPFKFKEWKQDQYIHLVKNEDYQALDTAASGNAGKKEVFINDLYYHFVPDSATRIAGLVSGEYDIVDDIPAESYQEVKSQQGINLHTDAGGTLTLFYNVTEGILANQKMRQAIEIGLNMEDIMLASYIESDLFELAPGYMNPSQKQWYSEAGKNVYNKKDVEKAKKLLKESGYNGEKVRLLTTKDYASMYSATLVVQDQLTKLGMNVEVEEYDFPTFMEKKQDFKNWDIFITSNSYQLLPQQLLVVNKEWAGANDPMIQEQLSKIRSAKTEDEAKKEWDKLQEFLYTYLSSSAIGQYKSITASSDKLEGFEVF
ncbi:putative peptide ABC transporter substrate-binding protein [Gottschalkia acidurici 9a]|uniref:Peptide ABC transporter substrate-binding protein n=1 Tax=Gottschalkia acidurici (strain ATCC 7906 / DSM 604 / BCRC 14475 / CIP 104303 / KCTC 5404 / NCIMB 10678 / 9a) TaxID=1128398 RepID=K0AY41_GOTA9|nr:ABC transporter substrate-binding protein [Gottschalkia acidurici]AFS78149.1 putative peptide ABC transporter substrate-binding protein [Gottschalkia acidurici 9a]